MEIYNLIPKDHYVTREELVRMTGLSDRKVRDEINALRKKPETLIISSSKQRGYKRPATVDELVTCLNESRSRVKEEQIKQSALEKAIREMKRNTEVSGGQMFFDFG